MTLGVPSREKNSKRHFGTRCSSIAGEVAIHRGNRFKSFSRCFVGWEEISGGKGGGRPYLLPARRLKASVEPVPLNSYIKESAYDHLGAEVKVKAREGVLPATAVG
ncbi:hypothetical protein J6590_034794 [Homalodisca vitripennis]|nr:hypothetical protein J6590_034794 [Homalodisca vitripennis]